MHPEDKIQIQLQDMKRQIEETRMEIRSQSNRLDGIFWKIGLLAGAVSIVMCEIYGNGIGGLFSDVMGWWWF